jgi:asparagine synthase (glutamine-hydrolysing)
MCGIAGIVTFKNELPSKNEVNTLIKSIKHRGPDDDGFIIQDNVALVHTRLSIIDLSINGKQPFESPDKRYFLTFNGEIYNYIELKNELSTEFTFQTNTDTEVLMYSYIKWGEKCLDKFNGMFSFALYDCEKKELFCARDRFGVKPFYYYHDKERFIFASEPYAIISMLKEKPAPDYQRIYDYLIFNRTDHDPDTFFQDIKKLQHGHQLSINGDQISIEKWFDLSKCNVESFKQHEEYYHFLKESISLRLRSDVPVGLTLSGGLDSSSIASILVHDLDKSDITTFSAIYGQKEKGDESNFINLYKDDLQLMNFIYPTSAELLEDLDDFIKTQQEPFGSTSIYANYKIMKEARNTVLVMLNGQGADEHLAGYHYFYGNFYFDLFKKFKWLKLSKEIVIYLKEYRSLMAIKSFLYLLLPTKLQSKYRIHSKGYLLNGFSEKYEQNSNVPKQLFKAVSLNDNLINHFEYKMEHLLKWDDRNSMRFGIESRNPFLDYRLVIKAIHMPFRFKIDKGMTKTILRSAMKGILPEQIRIRKDKVGFETPSDKWFRTTEFQELIMDILTSESFKNRNIIDTKKAISLYQKHLKGEIHISNEIWKWINLELWFRKFID